MEDNLIVKDTISSEARAAFFPFADVSFSCSWRGVLHINGRASRRIEILTPNMSQWNLHMKRYDDKWGKDRSNTTEWRAARAHEMDHWNSFNSFFAFLQLLNDFDETNLCHKCNEVKDELQLQYNMRWNSAYQHSAMYDTGGFNYGGAYPHGKTKKR